MTEKGDPRVLKHVVIYLRSQTDRTQAEFGDASEIDQADISRYELGKAAPPEKSLRRMAKAANVPWPVVVHVRRFYTVVVAVVDSARRGAGETSTADVDRAVLEPRHLAMAPYLLANDAALPRPKTLEEEIREAEETWTALERFPMPRRRRLIELSPRASWTLPFAVKLSHESERAAAHSVEEALELANLALLIAERVPGAEGPRLLRLKGNCHAYQANVLRVATDFAGADKAFVRAWNFWKAGAGYDCELFAEWRLLDLQASLRRAQQRFSEALVLLDQAFGSCGGEPGACGRILLKKEHVYIQQGDLQGAQAVLAEAVPWVEASGDPHLLFALRFNTADVLCRQESFTEAAALLPEVRELAAQHAGQLSRIRLVWLESKVAAGQGQAKEAMAGLEQVRRDFLANSLPCEAALASLELAILWLEAGRTADVRELALEMALIFKEKKIRREALAALTLFCTAAAQEAATVELVRRTIADVEKAWRLGPPPAEKALI